MSWDNKYYESKKSEKHVWEQIVTWHKMFFWMGWDVVSEVHFEKTFKQRTE